jgi:hypothetical protein
MRDLCFVCVAVVLLGCAGGVKPKEKETPGRPAREKLRTRAEFKAAVMGKSQGDVLKLLGKPSHTQESSGLGAAWVYERASYDPATGRVDPSADVLFDTKGVVTGVVF